MRKEERMKLEKEILDIMEQWPMSLDVLYRSGLSDNFKDFFQAILHLQKEGYICYHKIKGKTAYRRTRKGFNRYRRQFERLYT